jgi:hypothetical protein
MKTLRLFISSPGDVGRERHATAEIIRRLQSEFAEHVTLDPYFWEWEPVDFSKDYQANIPSTADFDIVICILWSRLGSRLSDQHKLPPDYTRPASSGTEYELLQALHGQQQHPDRLPDLLVWRNDSPPPPAASPPLDKEERNKRIAQSDALQDFLTSVTKDAATGSFIAALNSYQYLDQFEELMEGKLRKLIQKHIGERTVKPKPQWQGSPFRDLDVFEFEHAPIFFGRSRAVGEVVRLLQSTLSKPQSCHFALVLGASGSGKSSLARAGVLPLLTRPGVIEGIGLWRCAIVRPSDDSADLFQALAAALLTHDKKIGDKKTGPDFSVSNHQPPALPELADPESPNPQQSLAAELRAHPQAVAIRVKDQLNAVAKAHQAQQRHALEAQITSLTQEGRQADAAFKQQALQQLQESRTRLVLLLDQMEELFTLNYAPEQLRAFLETIAVLARSGRVFVIGTLRSDFYHRYQEQPTLVALARDGARFDLLPPTPDEISQIIRRPASLTALQFEPHPTTAEHTLADTLRDEALADTEALPLLEHVLNRLYQAQLPRADGRLTFADYEDICGVDVDPKTGVKTSRGVGGALGKHAEDIFTGQNLKPTEPPPPWTEDTVRAVFRCLVTFGKGEGDTDVPNRRAFTYQDLIKSDPAAQALVDTFIHQRLLIADTDAQSQAIVRLSHEALLTRWPRLSQWLQTATVRDLMSQRRRLESSLRQWQEQGSNKDYLLPSGLPLEEAKQLLEKHEATLKPEEKEYVRASEEHHKERERRVKRRRHITFAVLSSLTVLSLGAGSLAWWMKSKADSLVWSASYADDNAGRTALREGNGTSAFAHFHRALNYRMDNISALEGSAHSAFKGLRPTWRVTSAIQLGSRVRVTGIAFSDDGLWLAASLGDQSICLISMQKRIVERRWQTTPGVSGSLRFSSDNRTLIGLSAGEVALSIDVASGSTKREIKFHDDQTSMAHRMKNVFASTISPDGSLAAVGGEDVDGEHGSGYLVDLAKRTTVSLGGFFGSVYALEFSPDGRSIAVGEEYGHLGLIDTATQQRIAHRVTDEKNIYKSLRSLTEAWSSLTFSPDSQQLAACSDDGLLVICDVPSFREVSRVALGSPIDGSSFSFDGRWLVVASVSQIKLIRAFAGKIEASFALSCKYPALAFSPSDYTFAVGTDDGVLLLIDSIAGTEPINPSQGSRTGKDTFWEPVSDTHATQSWLACLKLLSAIQFDSRGILQPLTGLELLNAVGEVRSFAEKSSPRSEKWQHDILRWWQETPETRGLTPWSNQPLRVIAGKKLMQADPYDTAIYDWLEMASWHPLAPISLARYSRKTVATSEEAAGIRRLIRNTLKRLRDADEKLYGRDTLAEYAAWSAKIMGEELKLKTEALEALAFALECTSPEKQKELLELKAEIEAK